MVKTKTPTTLVILGATGDLIEKKIIPALWELYRDGDLPEHFYVLGVSRKNYDDNDFARHITKILAKKQIAPKKLRVFLKMFSYQQGDLLDQNTYTTIASNLGIIDKKLSACSNKLLYIATPPPLYKNILKHISYSGLADECSDETGWTRILIEKPFGSNTKTARELEQLLAKLFTEDQIYRIDHYLAKEIIEQIIAFRFANPYFNGNWDNTTIEKIEIRLLESLGVEKRGAFYDTQGALKDVGQNHALQILSLLTMETPIDLSHHRIREGKEKILSLLPKMTTGEVKKNTFRAQHTGYKKIPGVSQGSKTETFFEIQTYLKDQRFTGVPIVISAGKKCGKTTKEAVITFKQMDATRKLGCCQNTLTIKIEPKPEIALSFWIKKPTLNMEVEQKTLSIPIKTGGSQYIAEYKQLLLDATFGNQLSFVSSKEIIYSWKFIDEIIKKWNIGAVPLSIYPADTNPRPKKIEGTIDAKKPFPLGIIGAGKMGSNIARRLKSLGWDVLVFNRSPEPLKNLSIEGIKTISKNLVSFIDNIPSEQKIVWLMIPEPAIDSILTKLIKNLNKGDIIIDAGNSFYKNTVKRAKKCKAKGIRFIDVGISGGPSGALGGSCIMTGGEKKTQLLLEPLMKDLAGKNKYAFFDGSGAGHFVKMVHNGIEYGMMQSLAEGFAMHKKAKFDLDLAKIADTYNHGSVISSRLTQWLTQAYLTYGEELKDISGSAQKTGEGDWMVSSAKQLHIATPAISSALKYRKKTVKKPDYHGKIITALRNQFGGHSTKKP